MTVTPPPAVPDESSALGALAAALADRYRIERELGRGGMATVYLARDLRHDRPVALKVLHPQLASLLGPERFRREIKTAAGLQHPHILAVHDSGEGAGCLWFTMPYVAGESLRDRLRRERQLPLAQAVRLAREVALALDHAHRHGVVHRDVKPENILLAEDGQALLADFGIARALAAGTGPDHTATALTATGTSIGTPAYMSPEQVAGERELDGRSDTYSLGCVLYEMLAGEPPFSAPTPQALAAKHLGATPPQVRVTRATVPPRVERAIERALAKVPADRFGTADDFAYALDVEARPIAPPDTPPARQRRRGRPAIAALTATLLLGSAAILTRTCPWQQIRSHPLDPHRVVVFPLRVTGVPAAPEEGEAVATYIGYSLEGSEPLRWLDGWDRLSERERNGLVDLTPDRATGISRDLAARYYIDGTIIRTSDSTAVVLRLHDAIGDSVVTRAGHTQPSATADVTQLGLRAVTRLLPMLVRPGGVVDLSAFGARQPAPVAAFLQGEWEYRRMRFDRALPQYQRAVALDSRFAAAALKGAWAALWLERYDEARGLTDAVLAREPEVPSRYVILARGVRDHLAGAADSAAARFREAIRLDSTWVEAWTALGEVYYHLLPAETPLDSLADAAFLRAERLDSAFLPALFHLATSALRRGNVKRAEQLIRRIDLSDPEVRESSGLAVMLRCVRDGPATIDWTSVAGGSAARLRVGHDLTGGGYQLECARAAYRAAFEDTAASSSDRWGALLGLQGVLAAQTRWDELRDVLDSEDALKLSSEVLYLVLGSAGHPVKERAAGVGRRLGGRSTPVLWALGLWRASERDPAALESIVDTLAARADTSGKRRDILISKALALHLRVLRRDTTGAIAGLTELKPDAPLGDLEWQPWEALGAERVLLAELLLARGRFQEALQVAEQLDSPQPVIYSVYLSASLLIRIRAAEALGLARAADRYRARLAALRSAPSTSFMSMSILNGRRER